MQSSATAEFRNGDQTGSVCLWPVTGLKVAIWGTDSSTGMSVPGPGCFENEVEAGVSAERPSRVDGIMGVVESWFATGAQPRRTVPAAIARALEAREGRRCTHTLFLDKHHIQHWANGGATSLANLCQLCRYHHTFVHEYGWRIEKTAGVVRFFAPGGWEV